MKNYSDREFDRMRPIVLPEDTWCKERVIISGTLFECQKKNGHRGKHKTKGYLSMGSYCIKWERDGDMRRDE